MTELYFRIKSALENAQIDFKEEHHLPVRTSEQAAQVRGTPMHEGAKALVFLTETGPIQIVVPGDGKVDKENFKGSFGFIKLKMAGPDEAQKISGVEVGGIPPFGNLFYPPIPVYVSSRLLDNKYIEFNAGDRTISIRMKAKDYKDIVKPIIGDYETVSIEK